MKKLILSLLALVFLGACNSDEAEPLDEVGRFVPIILPDNYIRPYEILDTKTGIVYSIEGETYTVIHCIDYVKGEEWTNKRLVTTNKGTK